MKTESRDRKQKEAAVVFVVAEECGNVEALCQTFLKWGQVTFSQRGKATTTTTKKSEGWGEGTAAPVSLRRSRRSRERRGRAWAGCAGPGGGSGRSSLRGWDVGDVSFAAEPGAGGEEGRGYAEGAALLAVAPPLPVWPWAWLRPPGQALGARSSVPAWIHLHLLRRVLNGVSVRVSVLAVVPSALTP